MDDFNTNLLSEARNEYSSRLLNILTPLVIQGFRSIFKEAYELCVKNEESTKYLMTFQNFLSRVPKWNQEIINVETDRIVTTSKCSYLEDILTCVHITQLKILTSIRVSTQQKKIEIDIPKLSDFVHRVYIEAARKIYQNVYLFEKHVMPLQQQKNMRECEIIVRECILKVIADSMPIEKILRAYIDETEEEEIIEETIEKPEEEVKELLEKEEENNKNESETQLTSDASSNIVKIENETSDDQPISIASATTISEPESEKNKLKDHSSVATDAVVVNTEPMTTTDSLVKASQEVKSEVNKIKFNDTDSVLDMGTNKSNQILAPKTLDRLEKISKEREDKRKQEEAEYDDDDDDDFGFDNEKIKILDESPKLELDKLDVNDISSSIKIDSPPLLDDVVELS